MIKRALTDTQRLYLVVDASGDKLSVSNFIDNVVRNGYIIKDIRIENDELLLSIITKGGEDLKALLTQMNESLNKKIEVEKSDADPISYEIKVPDETAKEISKTEEDIKLPNIKVITTQKQCLKIYEMVKYLPDDIRTPYIDLIKRFLRTKFNEYGNKRGLIIAYRNIFYNSVVREMKKKNMPIEKELSKEAVAKLYDSMAEIERISLYQSICYQLKKEP